MAIMARCFMPPDSSWGYLDSTRSGSGILTCDSISRQIVLARSRLTRWCRMIDLGHLVADGKDRVQGAHGLLEDHGDVVPPDLPQPLPVHPQDVLSLETDFSPWVILPGGSGMRRKMERASTDFAASGFPDQTEDFAAPDREVNPSSARTTPDR